jgi:hypothetical protein
MKPMNANLTICTPPMWLCVARREGGHGGRRCSHDRHAAAGTQRVEENEQGSVGQPHPRSPRDKEHRMDARTARLRHASSFVRVWGGTEQHLPVKSVVRSRFLLQNNRVAVLQSRTAVPT